MFTTAIIVAGVLALLGLVGWFGWLVWSSFTIAGDCHDLQRENAELRAEIEAAGAPRFVHAGGLLRPCAHCDEQHEPGRCQFRFNGVSYDHKQIAGD